MPAARNICLRMLKMLCYSDEHWNVGAIEYVHRKQNVILTDCKKLPSGNALPLWMAKHISAASNPIGGALKKRAVHWIF